MTRHLYEAAASAAGRLLALAVRLPDISPALETVAEGCRSEAVGLLRALNEATGMKLSRPPCLVEEDRNE